VPVRRYSAVGPVRGVVLFSVGFGGDRDGYGFFARCWASLGLTTLVIEHVGSNLEVLRSFPQRRRDERNAEVVRRVKQPAELRARPRDLQLVWNHVKDEFQGLPLGLGGHSYGSYSVLACAGMVPTAAQHDVAPLPALSLLVISPQPPGLLFSPNEYQKVDKSVLVVTGTRDTLLSGDGEFKDRLEAYRLLPDDARKHCLVLKDFEHMDFAGVGLNLASKLSLLQEMSRRWWKRSLLFEGMEQSWSDSMLSALGASKVEFCE
jgi:pimeloyl-ACP methyl ester carboxylesterase